MKRAAAALLGLLAACGPSELEQNTATLSRQVEELRGLKFKGPVEVGLYDLEALRTFLIGEIDREMPPEKLAAAEKAFKAFGAIPADTNLRRSIEEMLTVSILGFYHPRTKELRVVRKGGKEELKMVVPHELCHALQDQSFDLLSYPIEEKHNDDLVAALKALIEGDATILGLQHARQSARLPQIIQHWKSAVLPGKAADEPEFLRRGLTFPYGYGTEFVVEIRRRGGNEWSAVDRLFENPPASTEQIMHPEKYFGRDAPQLLSHDRLAFEGWTLLDHNVLGEFQTMLLTSPEAAEGWDGDRYWVFESGNGSIRIVWFSTWDSEKEAAEFERAWSGGSVERRGTDLLVVIGGTTEGLWEGLKKTELTKVPRTR